MTCQRAGYYVAVRIFITKCVIIQRVPGNASNCFIYAFPCKGDLVMSFQTTRSKIHMAINSIKGKQLFKLLYSEADGKRINLYKPEQTRNLRNTNFTTHHVTLLDEEIWPFFTNIHYNVVLERRYGVQKFIYLEMKYAINEYAGRFDEGLLAFPSVTSYCRVCMKPHNKFIVVFYNEFFDNVDRHVTTSYLQFYESSQCASTQTVTVTVLAQWSHIGEQLGPASVINETHMTNRSELFSVSGQLYEIQFVCDRTISIRRRQRCICYSVSTLCTNKTYAGCQK